jgi:aspartyl-tRNA(Asn)/glutamyl-tRNA(Gln) amidotransferase subunit A
MAVGAPVRELDTVAGAAAALAAGTLSSVELAQELLARIGRLDPLLNAFITVTGDAALAAAAAADARRAAGERGRLLGVPIAHKDVFVTTGIRTTCGSRMLADWEGTYDATVVARLAAAGCVALGKTNMDEFAMGSSNESSHFGAVANPWDLSRVPGGSSGGSAAAVAAGLVPAATGTDTGGSIRQPAAFCGLTGLKPTYGRVSRFGMVAFASSLDQAGVFAASAEDCALLLAAMAGVDARDATSADVAVDDYVAAVAATAPSRLRIGLPREYFAGLDAGIGERLDALRRLLAGQGHVLVDVSLPHTAAAVPCYYIIAPAECSANLSRFDGVRFGHRCTQPRDLDDLYRRSRSEGFGAEVRRRILAGTYVLSVGYFDAYYLQAQRVRRLIRDDFTAAFRDVDLLLTPTAPTTAFARGAVRDPITMYRQDVYTTPASLAGVPAVSFPIGLCGGLPVGAQFIAPHFA